MSAILIVEDEKPVAAGLAYMIRRSLPELRIAGTGCDGADGLKKAEMMKPDLILTDITMPGMDGLEMIEKVQEAGLDCGYILLSGYSEFEYAKRAMHLGVREYLTKPVNEKELMAAIQRVLAETLREREERKMAARARCLPPEEHAVSPDAGSELDTIVRIRDYIRAHAAEPLTLKELGQVFYLNPSYISQLFKNKTGESYISFLTGVRMEMARMLLETTDLKVIDICERVGYNDCSHFTRTFERETGQRPNEYRMAQRTGRKR